MGLFDFFKKRKNELLELQQFLIDGSPDRLIVSRKRLMELAKIEANNSLRIVQDSSRLVQTTTKPDVFFGRMQLMLEHSSNLAYLERYVPFTGASPMGALKTLLAEEQEVIKNFLIRYCWAVVEKADKLKTEKGQFNQWQKFYDSLSPYFHVMNDENVEFIETKYKAYTRYLKP